MSPAVHNEFLRRKSATRVSEKAVRDLCDPSDLREAEFLYNRKVLRQGIQYLSLELLRPDLTYSNVCRVA